MAQGYYAGVTLRELQKANPAYATQSALKSLTLPLLEAVELLQSRQCIHRDIATDNIIVQPGGVPVLLDFGAARRIIGDMTRALTAVLKPSYAPIEQYTEEAGLAQGPWTDGERYQGNVEINFKLQGDWPASLREYSHSRIFACRAPQRAHRRLVAEHLTGPVRAPGGAQRGSACAAERLPADARFPFGARGRHRRGCDRRKPDPMGGRRRHP